MQPVCPAAVTAILGLRSAAEMLRFWISGSQTSLHIRVTFKWHLLKIPQSRPQPRLMTSQSWGEELRPESFGGSLSDPIGSGTGSLCFGGVLNNLLEHLGVQAYHKLIHSTVDHISLKNLPLLFLEMQL